MTSIVMAYNNALQTDSQSDRHKSIEHKIFHKCLINNAAYSGELGFFFKYYCPIYTCLLTKKK